MRIRCGRFPDLHTQFNVHKKQCASRGCVWPLERYCEHCNTWGSYSNFAKHVCRGRGRGGLQPNNDVNVQVVEEHRKLRFVYLASAWELDIDDEGGKFRVLPMGQFREALPVSFPKQSFRMLHVNDPSGDSYAIDSYDAVWGTIAMDAAHYELVHVYHTLDELLDAIRGNGTLPEGLDMIVMGEWIHPVIYKSNSKPEVERILVSLHALEVERNLRVFPPLEYSWYFAQKCLYLTRAAQLIPKSLRVKPIPMLPVPMGHVWKPQVQEFVRQHEVTKLMFKRELSDCRKHAVELFSFPSSCNVSLIIIL